jgi:hypothetical protein
VTPTEGAAECGADEMAVSAYCIGQAPQPVTMTSDRAAQCGGAGVRVVLVCTKR